MADTDYTTASTSGAPAASPGLVDQAKDKAAGLASQAREKATGLADEARSRATDALSSGKEQATGALGGVAETLRATGDSLREKDQDLFAGYLETAADQVERFTSAIRDRNVGDLLDEAERFARREPGLFIGGAFVLGVFGARFLKATAPSGGSAQGQGLYGGYDTSYGSGAGYGGASSMGGFSGTSGASGYGGPSSRTIGGYTGTAGFGSGEPSAPMVAGTAGAEMPDPSELSGESAADAAAVFGAGSSSTDDAGTRASGNL